MSKLTDLTGEHRKLMTQRDELEIKQAKDRVKVQAKIDAVVEDLRSEQAKAETRTVQSDKRATEKQRQKEKKEAEDA